ncbi:MAG: TonB-dependent receptor [Muribaculaceae bacterium]|nr:TonB-dependent receptor [Muribaculaceae bacterium]
MNPRNCILLLFAILLSAGIKAQDTKPTLINDTIQEITVTAKAHNATSISRHGDKISLSTHNLSRQVNILGSADAFKYIQLLPGVKTNSDYTTGTSVQGCDFSHTAIEMDEATLFYPYHLLGIFSACNNDHFSSVSLEKSIHSADFANRLGGKISVMPHNVPIKKFTGSANIGLISSGTSLSIPLSSQCALILSGRLSYLNTLYSGLMENKDNKINYDFFDTNLTFIYKKNKANTLSINALLGQDRLKCYNKESFLNLKMGWDNTAISASWEHTGKTYHKSSISFSDLKNELQLQMPEFNIGIPAEISHFSAKEKITVALGKKLSFNTGCALEYYRLLENNSNISGMPDENHTSDSHYSATESRLHGELDYLFHENWELRAGIKATYYHTSDYDNVSADPLLTLRFTTPGTGAIAVHTGIYSQYLHQTGFSSNGLPTDFWFLANSKMKKQKAFGISASWKHKIKPFNLNFVIETYYKRILDQPEFNGSVMSMIYNEFDAYDNLLNTTGFNTGIDIMLQKQFGKLSGWLSYSLGIARRKIPELADGYVPSSGEQLHNLSVTVNYKLNNIWSFASNFVFASGTPTTPILSVFMLGENIMCNYGEYNSWHLPDYHRLDLSATCTLPRKAFGKYAHSLNLSIVNAYANKNVMLQYFSYSEDDATFKFKEVSTMFKILPSISYRIEF